MLPNYLLGKEYEVITAETVTGNSEESRQVNTAETAQELFNLIDGICNSSLWMKITQDWL